MLRNVIPREKRSQCPDGNRKVGYSENVKKLSNKYIYVHIKKTKFLKNFKRRNRFSR